MQYSELDSSHLEVSIACYLHNLSNFIKVIKFSFFSEMQVSIWNDCFVNVFLRKKAIKTMLVDKFSAFQIFMLVEWRVVTNLKQGNEQIL